MLNIFTWLNTGALHGIDTWEALLALLVSLTLFGLVYVWAVLYDRWKLRKETPLQNNNLSKADLEEAKRIKLLEGRK